MPRVVFVGGRHNISIMTDTVPREGETVRVDGVAYRVTDVEWSVELRHASTPTAERYGLSGVTIRLDPRGTILNRDDH